MAPKGHPVALMVRARELHDAGWNRADVRRLLGKELGVEPNERTIRRWLDPKYAQRRRESDTKIRTARRRLARMEELRNEVRLSHRAIAALMSHDYPDLDLTPTQVRNYLLGKTSERTMRRLLYPEGARA